MSDLMGVQKEFEELINELKKLKKINEITTSNTKNTEKILQAIESFVKSVNSFKDEVLSQYSIEYDQIEMILDKTEGSTKDLIQASKSLTTAYYENIDKFSKEVANQHQDTSKKINSQIISLGDNLTDVNNKNYEDISLNYEKIQAALDDYKNNLKQYSKDIAELTNQMTEKYIAETKSNQVNFLKKIESLQQNCSNLQNEISISNAKFIKFTAGYGSITIILLVIILILHIL